MDGMRRWMAAYDAAEYLATRARDSSGRVVVVTHATFRMVLARALARRGWRGPDQRPYREWSAWRFVLGAPDTPP